MQIAVTHNNADFDALASLIAATFLYPGSVGVLPRQLQPGVKEFLAVHRDLFRVCSVKDLDLSEVERLIVVDTNNWSRLDGVGELKGKKDLAIDLWDHHMSGCNIDPSHKWLEESGATITLMLREMRNRDVAFSPIHATLFLLGIYDDTGNLTYPSTTAQDAYAAGFLLENGADLNVADAYLNSALDDNLTDLFTRMLESAQTFTVAGSEVGIALLSVDRSTGMLSSVVTKYKEIKGLDTAFGIFCTEEGKCMVIGRAGAAGINVGAVMRTLGGGGHPGAGSAMVKGGRHDEVYRKVCGLIRKELEKPEVRIRDIMSKREPQLSPGSSISDALSLLEETRSAAILVEDKGTLSGVISRAECRKAKPEAIHDTPVKAFMRTHIPSIHPDQSPREALRIMAEEDPGLLPVVENGKVVGVVTRADLMLHLYTF